MEVNSFCDINDFVLKIKMNKSLNFFVIFAVVCGSCLFSLTLADDIEDNETSKKILVSYLIN